MTDSSLLTSSSGSPSTTVSLPVSLTSGTNQGQRNLASLNPQSVGIDERSLADFFDFTLAYSQGLNYYGPDNQANGDWSGLLNPDGLAESDWETQRDQLIQFLNDPENAPAIDLHGRAHLLLFAAFLNLLQMSQQQINQLTQRHLDFYYQDYLRLGNLAGVPDSVNVLASLPSGISEALLPAGTLLAAGKDSAGNNLSYATQEDLLVTSAQIGQLSSVFVNKKVTGIEQARVKCTGTSEDALLAMLGIPYGASNPGDKLPIYPVPVYHTNWVPGDMTSLGISLPVANVVTVPFLQNLLELTQFVANPLYLEFDEFSQMMLLKDRQGTANTQAIDNWNAINGFLAQAGQNRAGSTFQLNLQDPRDFNANLDTALGGSPNFNTLPGGIETIYDLYDHRTRADVQDYIPHNIYLKLDPFNQMMQIKVAIDADWWEVNNLLARANQRKCQQLPGTPVWPPSGFDNTSPNFIANLQAALDTLSFPAFPNMELGPLTNIDQFSVALQFLEGYFFSPAADFELLMKTWANPTASPEEWDTVYANLQTAYVNRVYGQQLRGVQQKAQSQQATITGMLQLALDQPATVTGQNLLDQLSFYLAPASAQYVPISQAMQPGAATLTQDQWTQVVSTLVWVWRNRLGADPVPQQVAWECLSANADASTVQAEVAGNTARWRTFGQQPAPAQGPPLTSPLGWSITSPLLCLSQGTRTVQLVLGFDPASFSEATIDKLLATNPYPFTVQVSNGSGWFTPSKLAISRITYDDKTSPPSTPPTQLQGLSFVFTLSVSDPPVAALTSLASPWPVLRLLLQTVWPDNDNDQGGNYVTPYPLFSSLALDRVWLGVTVQGLQGLQMQNDESTLDASKPFTPFGSSPSVGSSFSFAHSELAVKCLDSITLNCQWMKLPAQNLASYYANYPAFDPALPGRQGNSAFTFQISLVDLSAPLCLNQGEPNQGEPMFEATDATKPWTVKIPVASTLGKNFPNYAYVPDTTPCDYSQASGWRRFWQLELKEPDFQQDAYPSVASALSIQLATAIAAGSKPSATSYQINPPYTPTLKTFSVDYQATVEVLMTQYPSGVERIYYQQALAGYAEIQADANGIYRILPAYDNEGELYIGLQGVVAPQTVSILFQLAVGSADPDLPPQPIEWDYLSGNQWISLQQGQLLVDGTLGFTVPGIIVFQLPPAQANTLLPADLYWLRAAVAENSDSLCDTIAIQTQAVLATWVDQNNTADHLNQPLPAQTITKTVNSIPGIATISQPYTSFGGKPAENDSLFYVRVSERLRHKQRALTFWDYENLILSQFPDIYTAKCIPSSLAGTGRLGQVIIVVIPDVCNNLPFNPFAPKVSAGKIGEIQSYLDGCLSPLADVVVQNPVYVPVRVRFAVRFMPGCDPGYYTPKLNTALCQFLSPWAYDGSSEVVIGNKIYANNIINCLERLSYVDYLADLSLFKSEDGTNYVLVQNPGDGAGYCVQAGNPNEVLGNPNEVLVSAQQHVIDLITDNDFEQENFSGIGYMEIQLDFVVG